MFCKHCNTKLDVLTECCPYCGATIEEGGILLNPKPTTIFQIMPPKEDNIEKVITQEEIKVEPETVKPSNNPTVGVENDTIVSEPVDTVKEKGGSVATVVSFDDITTQTESIQATATESTQVTATDKEQNKDVKVVSLDFGTKQPQVEVPKEALPVTDTTEAKKRNRVPVIVICAIIILVIGCILFLNRNKKDTLTKTDQQITTTEYSTQDIVLEEVTPNEEETILIDEKEYKADDTKEYNDVSSDVVVKTYSIDLTKEHAQRYVDEQEVKFQLEDSSILDVRYLDSVFVYHYDGYYQYGFYKKDCLYLYEISDSVAASECDKLALEHFKSLEAIK